MTFGRWARKDGNSHFVTGVPDASARFKQPVMELHSWKDFLESSAAL
jgi:hypothetical protein